MRNTLFANCYKYTSVCFGCTADTDQHVTQKYINYLTELKDSVSSQKTGHMTNSRHYDSRKDHIFWRILKCASFC